MRLNRRRVSRANSALLAEVSARSTASFIPRSRMVSIIPGMEWVAPERTLTSSGCGPRPNVHDVSASSQLMPSSTSSQIVARVFAGSARYRTPTSVVMQNAGGTGSLCRRMASMPWPLLPKIFRGRFALPSSNTTLRPVEAPLPGAIRAVVHPLRVQLLFERTRERPLCSHTDHRTQRVAAAVTPCPR